MSFPPANEIFQFAGFASHRYGFTMGYPPMSPLGGGLPHSDISGSPGARPSPELFAACHVLHRLSVPRHPPDALLVLAHAQPQGRAKRGQRSDVRGQRSDQAGLSSVLCLPSSEACVRIAPTRATRPGVLHTHARARPSDRQKPESSAGLSCHARFTVTTRFTMSKTSMPARAAHRANPLGPRRERGHAPSL